MPLPWKWSLMLKATSAAARADPVVASDPDDVATHEHDQGHRSTQSTWVKRCRSRSEICFKGAKKRAGRWTPRSGGSGTPGARPRPRDGSAGGGRPSRHASRHRPPTPRVARRQVRCAHVPIVADADQGSVTGTLPHGVHRGRHAPAHDTPIPHDPCRAPITWSPSWSVWPNGRPRRASPRGGTSSPSRMRPTAISTGP